MPEPANSAMSAALETAQKVNDIPEKKEKVALPQFERINEKGEVESWNERTETRKDGTKIYFLDDGSGKRYAILSEAERKAEQDMVERGKKFRDEKVWQSFVSILDDAKESGKELNPTQKYLIANRGRILEDAILTAEIDKLSPEEALGIAAERAVNISAGIGYKEVAKSIEFFANDYTLNNSAEGRTPAEQKAFIAQQKEAARRARLADLTSFAYGMSSLRRGDETGENTEVRPITDAYDNLKTRRALVRDYYGDEVTRAVTLRGQVRQEKFHPASIAYMDAEAEKNLAAKRRELAIAIKEGEVDGREATIRSAELVKEMNAYRIATGREAVTDPKDMPREWQYLLGFADMVNQQEIAAAQVPAEAAPVVEEVRKDDILQARAKKIRARRAEAEKVFAEGQMSPARRVDQAPTNLPVEDEVMTDMQQAVERIVAPVREKTPPKKVVMRKYTPPAEAAPAPIAAAPLANEAEFELMNKKEIKAVKAPRNLKEQMVAAPEVQAEVQAEAQKKAKREKTAPLAEAPTVPSVPRRSSGSFSGATVVREVPKPKASVLSRMWNFFWGAPAKIQEAAAVAQENAGL